MTGENKNEQNKVTWVKPQDLNLDNARTEYCKVLDLFLIENAAAQHLAKANQEQLEKINELSQQIKELKKKKE